MINIVILIVVILGVRFVMQTYSRKNGAPGTSLNKEAVNVENVNVGIIMKTSKGDIHIKFFPEIAPMTVTNMMTLAKNGYYNNIKFHRVIKDFMIQGGDPTGTGSGGPGYNFKDEVTRMVKFDKPGILAMANAGPGTNGSQFFITHVPTDWLNMKHTIFGEVVSPADQEVVNKIAQGDLILGMELTGDYEAFLDAQKELVQNIEEVIKK